MTQTLEFLQPSALAEDIAIFAKRNGKTVPAYLRERMVEALMADIATDVLSHYDLSSDEQIDDALQRLRDLSDELIQAIADFKYGFKRRRFLHKLREANTEGSLTAAQNEVFETLVDEEEEFSIVKAIAKIEVHRRGLKKRRRSRNLAPTSRSK
jgi:hypothetical protein